MKPSSGGDTDKLKTENTETPETPQELLSIQQDQESNLIYGLNLSAKARAMHLYSEEIELTIKDRIDLAYTMIREAEGGLEYYLEGETRKYDHQQDKSAIVNNAVWVGGLKSLRLGLRSLVESPMEPDVWTTYGSNGKNSARHNFDRLNNLRRNTVSLIKRIPELLLSKE